MKENQLTLLIYSIKVFFDRLSDLLTIHKDKGRALANKNIWLLSCGTGEEIPEGFEVPFRDTADYFDMRYKGYAYLYTQEGENLKPLLAQQTESAVRNMRKQILQG